MTTINRKAYIKQYYHDFPVLQSFHTGLWGFERIMDCLDLNKCIYKSEHAAKCARAKAAADQYHFDFCMEPPCDSADWRKVPNGFSGFACPGCFRPVESASTWCNKCAEHHHSAHQDKL